MDAMSSKWRDDPVRAINEKKKARANAEEARSIAQSRAKELLEQKLSQAQKAGDARDLEQVGSLDHDAAYRLENERHRRRLLEGNSDSDSSSSEVHDPFMSRQEKRRLKEEKRRKEKREKKAKKEKKERKKEKDHKREKKEKKKKRSRSEGSSDSESEGERKRRKKEKKEKKERSRRDRSDEQAEPASETHAPGAATGVEEEGASTSYANQQ